MTRRHCIFLWVCAGVFLLPGAARSCAQTRVQSDASLSALADTLVLSHPSMVFFLPSTVERDSLIDRRTVFAFDSLTVRFESGRDRLAPFLKKQGIDPVTSSAVRFYVQMEDSVFYTRRVFRELFGIIYFKPGKPPLVVPGVPAEPEMFKTMMRYFEIHR